MVIGNKVNHGGNDQVGWVLLNMKGAIVIARVMVVIFLAILEVVDISVGIERHVETQH